jgi:signal transduction histidine kinase
MATHDHTGNADEITPQARTLTSEIGELHWALDLRSREIAGSRAWCEKVGLDPDQSTVSLDTLLERIHPDDRARYGSALDFAGRHGRFETSYRVRPNGGSYAVVHDRSLMAKGDAPPSDVLVGAMRVSDDRILDALRDQPTVDPMATGAPAGRVGYFTYVLEPDGTDRIEGLSPGCGAIWGLSDEQVLADMSVVWAGIEPTYIGALQTSIATSARTLAPWTAEYRITLANGDHRWLQGFGVPERTASGGTSWQTVIADVTDAKLKDREIEDANQLFRDLTANVPGVVFRYAIFPDGTDAITFMSEGSLNIWEVDATNLRNDPTLLWKMVHPDDIEAMQQSVGASAQDLSDWVHRWRIETASGARKWLEGRGKPRRLDDGTIVWNSFIVDVSKEINAQEEIERRDAKVRSLTNTLESVSRINAMGELSSAIAHELNQPLAAAMNYAHAAQLTLGDVPESTRTVEILDKTVKQVERAAQIVSRLRSLFVRGKLVKKPGSLNAAADAALAVAGRDAPGSITFDRRADSGLPDIAFDDIQIQLVIMNLVRNAVQAIGARRDGRILVETFDRDDMVGFCVDDNGPGIPEDRRAEIFTAFTSTKPDGSGVGLSICHSIVNAHGGRIWIEDSGLGGARIMVLLPKAEP